MRIIQSENPRPLTLLALGPGGLVAATSTVFGAGTDVEVWQGAIGAHLTTCHCTRHHTALAFDATGAHLLIGQLGFGIAAFDTRTGQTRSELEYLLGTTTFALYPDSTRLLVASHVRWGVVECLAIDSNMQFSRLWSDGPHASHEYHAPATDPTGSRVAVVERFDGKDGRPRQEISLRDAATGKVRRRIPTDASGPVRQLAFTTDSSKLLARIDSNKVQLFDANTGAPAGELKNPGRPYVTGIAVHPRGPVACARTNGTVTFWNAEKREPIRTLDWKAGKLVSVAFSPDGSLGAAGTEDGKVVVWDVDL